MGKVNYRKDTGNSVLTRKGKGLSRVLERKRGRNMDGKKLTLGLIPASRGFFSNELAIDMRARTLKAMEKTGAEIIVPDDSMTELGCVESLEDAEKTGRLFREKEVDGVVIGAMNFGDEQGVALTVKEMGLPVPLLAFGGQEIGVLSPEMERRDSFCGLISICETLREVGFEYSLPRNPICYPEDHDFRKDLGEFVAVCRVVSGVRNARIGQVGTRPDAFWTCRFSEKALQGIGVTVVTRDLSELIARVQKMEDEDPRVKETVEDIGKMADRSNATNEQITKIAKLEIALKEYIEERKLDALAIQCWTSLQENLGISACTAMARLGENGIPCACEADVPGALSMYMLRLAADQPAALADWNNLHPDDPEVVNLWHCGVNPPSFAKDRPIIKVHDILASGTIPGEQTVGTLQAKMKNGPVTLARVAEGKGGEFKIYLGEGEVIDIPGTTYGAYGWSRVPGLKEIYPNVILRHFPHHVAFAQKHVGNILYEATGKYLGFAPYYYGQRQYGEFEPARPFSDSDAR